MKGTLAVVKTPPHFIRFTLKLNLEDGMDNLCLRRSTSPATIYQMRKDEQEGVYILDYVVPLHMAARDSVYLVDDMVSIERLPEGEKPVVLANIRLSLARRELKFLCSSNVSLTIKEAGSWEFQPDDN